MDEKEMIEKINDIRKVIQKMREWTLSPAIDSSLREMDVHAFLIQDHLGIVGEQFCPEDYSAD